MGQDCASKCNCRISDSVNDAVTEIVYFGIDGRKIEGHIHHLHTL